MSDFPQLTRDEVGKAQAAEYVRTGCYVHCGELTLFQINSNFLLSYGGREVPRTLPTFDLAWEKLLGQQGILWVEDPQRDKKRILELERQLAALQAERSKLQRVRGMLSHHQLALTYNGRYDLQVDGQEVPVGWCVFYHDVCQGQHYLELLACDEDLADAVDLAAVSGLRNGLLQHVFLD